MAISADLYRTFFGVGLHLSFSKTAKEFGVSQSAISQSIKLLEKELGMTLFQRTTKSVSFTPEGKELFDTVAKAFSVLDSGVMQLQERVKHDRGSLKLAATDTLCRYFLLPYLRQWQMQETDMGLQITNRTSPDCVRLVEEKKAELAVVNTFDEIMENPQLEMVELSNMRYVFVGGPAYKGKSKMTLANLMQEPILLLCRGAASRNFFEKITKGQYKQPTFELNSLDVLMDLVEINMGIALVPEVICNQKIKEGSIVEIETDVVVPDRKVGLVWSRLRPLSIGASKFIDLLVNK